jgi:hypothetical protein
VPQGGARDRAFEADGIPLHTDDRWLLAEAQRIRAKSDSEPTSESEIRQLPEQSKRRTSETPDDEIEWAMGFGDPFKTVAA